MKPYRVTVYSRPRVEYLSALYAGLFELSAAGAVELKFARSAAPAATDDSAEVTLRLDVETAGSGRALRLCFDTADWRNVASMSDLQAVDVYFKRSYDATHLARLDRYLRDKVVPLGLHYGCTSRNESFVHGLQDAIASERARGALATTPLRSAARMLGIPLRTTLAARGLWDRAQLPLYIDEFEVDPQEPAEAKIFYRTRVYGPEDAPENFRLGRMDEINNQRAGIVRALRRHFGDRFVGGLRDSAFARSTYADCLFPGALDLRGHVALSRSCLINVNTAGLHDSTSWKIPEYLAGSRCIVSEPTVYETPVPLVEGLHYLAFTSPEQCVSACERLFTQPRLAQAMRAASFAYYSEHVRPDRLMSHCLQVALERANLH